MEGRICTVVNRAELLPQREFRCKWCVEKVYKSRARYQGHLKHIHNIKTEPGNSLFNCYHCPCGECRHHKHAPGVSGFRKMFQLRRHYQTHHLTKNYTCAFCQRDFELERDLFIHRCCPPNTVAAEDREAPEHVPHKEVPKSHTKCEKEYSSQRALRQQLFRTKHKAVDQQSVSQHDDKENKPKPSNGRQMQKCTQCKKKYILRHRCCEHPCHKCGRIFFCKSALEHHMKKSTHSLLVEDKLFVDEVLQLIGRIEDGTIGDPPLLKELAALLPVLQEIQETVI